MEAEAGSLVHDGGDISSRPSLWPTCYFGQNMEYSSLS